MGDADSALKDAESCLKDTNDFTKGLFQKAEALYAMGDFEFALVHYHRGNKLRPELNEFRLGIQKAREAIDNSIGSKLFLLAFILLDFLTGSALQITDSTVTKLLICEDTRTKLRS